MTYADKLKDPRWQKKRLGIFQRDNYTCRDCGNQAKQLHVHHCGYIKGREPWDVPDKLLLTLCEDCHEIRGDLETDLKLAVAYLCARCAVTDLEAWLTSMVTLVNFCDCKDARVEWSEEDDNLNPVPAYDTPSAKPQAMGHG